MGWFEMGSTIALIFEGSKDLKFAVKPNQKVQLGQALAK